MKWFFFLIAFFYSDLPLRALPKLAVMPLNSIGLDDTQAKSSTKLLQSRLIRISKFEVKGADQVESLAAYKELQQTVGCDNQYCIIDLASTLECEFAIYGTISQFNDDQSIEISILDLTTGSYIASSNVSSRRLAIDNFDQLISELMRQYDAYMRGEVINPNLRSRLLLRGGLGKTINQQFPGHQAGFYLAFIDFNIGDANFQDHLFDLRTRASFRYLTPGDYINNVENSKWTYSAMIGSVDLGVHIPLYYNPNILFYSDLLARASYYREQTSQGQLLNNYQLNASSYEKAAFTIGGVINTGIELYYHPVGYFIEAGYSYEPIGKDTITNIGGFSLQAGVSYRKAVL